MNTCEAVEIIEGEAQENINDSVPEKPQVKKTGAAEIIGFAGVLASVAGVIIAVLRR